MAQIFPPWVNRAVVRVGAGLTALAVLGVLGIWYFFSPEFTDVGYRPRQPVPFSHLLHAGELEIDCRYCHVTVEVSAVASVPATQICMNCHELVSRASPALSAVRESAESGEPLRWVRVHKVPEYAYFHHGVHVRAGVECRSCHGAVEGMERLMQVEPLSMGWCLDCHRAHRSGGARARVAVNAANREQGPPREGPPTDCSGCHR